MVKVSVIIPVYKVEAYLPACMDSVLGQTLRDIEVICIDDASPDNCPAILDAYAAKDPRVKVIHLPENHQQGYARNRGIETAEGKYLYFLDSDDMITPDALEKLSACADRDELDSIFFDSEAIFESEELRKKNAAGYQGRRQGLYEDKVYTGRELYDAFIWQREWNCYVQREFWRREFILENDVRFPEATEHEDEFFPFKGVLLAKRVRYMPEAFFLRRYRENSVMTRAPHPKDFHGYFVTFCLMVDFVEDHGIFGHSIDVNVVHMYERMSMFYSLFVRQGGGEDWFKTEDQKARYRFYTYARKIGIYSKERLRGAKIDYPEGTRFWIYGAGVIGSRAYELLLAGNYVVEGFLVTKKGNNPDILFGRKVLEIADAEVKDDQVVMLAANGYFQDQMKAVAEEKGWRYCFYPVGR